MADKPDVATKKALLDQKLEEIQSKYADVFRNLTKDGRERIGDHYYYRELFVSGGIRIEYKIYSDTGLPESVQLEMKAVFKLVYD